MAKEINIKKLGTNRFIVSVTVNEKKYITCLDSVIDAVKWAENI